MVPHGQDIMKMDRVLKIAEGCEVLPGTRSNTNITDTQQILLPSTGQKSSPSVTVSLPLSLVLCLPVLPTTPSLTQGTHSFSQRTSHLFTNFAETPAAEISPFQERLKLTFLHKVHKKTVASVHNAVPLSEGFLVRCQSTGDLRSVRLLSLFV